MKYSTTYQRNNFGNEAWFDEEDWLNFDQNLFKELWENQDTNSVKDRPPPTATNEIAAQIYGQFLQQDPTRTRAFVAHLVEPEGVQSEEGRRSTKQGVGSLIDVSFVGQDGRRVNLEVDPSRNINRHAEHHRRAMQAAVKNNHTPDSSRSVFIGVDGEGRIQQIRHVHYERRGNRIVPVEDANVTLTTPLTAQQAVQQGVLDNPTAAQRVAVRQTGGSGSAPRMPVTSRRSRPAPSISHGGRRRGEQRHNIQPAQRIAMQQTGRSAPRTPSTSRCSRPTSSTSRSGRMRRGNRFDDLDAFADFLSC